MVKELECYLVRVNHYHSVLHSVKVVVRVKESHYYLELDSDLVSYSVKV